MGDPEVEAFAREWQLGAAGVRALDALVSRLRPAETVRGPSAVTLFAEPVEGDAPPVPVVAADRYDRLGVIAVGGMGEVWRVRDATLNRVVALKVLRADLARDAASTARFVDEAQCSAQLQHPGLIPVHELGHLPDGRPFFTMPEVRGRTLTEVLAEVHDGVAGGWSFPRLVDAFRRACEAVAYAHACGVLHRDLKPDNVMVGAHGEVLVLDWGLAKVIGGSDAPGGPVVTDRSADPARATRLGVVAGTPAYMSPEQASGDLLDARSDVYALGAILYEILSGYPPYRAATWQAVLAQVRAGPPAPLPPGPPELGAACRRAMARAPADRFADAGALAAEVSAWLEGARRREQALAVLARAAALEPLAAAARGRAAALRREAGAALANVPVWADEDEKAAGWALEDEAAALERDAARYGVEAEQTEQAALQTDPGLPEAHAALCTRYLRDHAAREAARTDTTAAEGQLRRHADALPARHPLRAKVAAYLAGDGVLTLVTDPPGAEVLLFRYTPHRRRLVPAFERSLGPTPLRAVALPMGSYLCVLRAPGRPDVAYPVAITRGRHWDGVPPGATAAAPLVLPAPDALGPDDVYVPAGWFDVGGDPGAVAGLPARRAWCDALVARRFQVTNREYVAFLDDLVATGREDLALRWVPRERPATQADPGALCYGRDADGRFVLVADAEGDVWLPDYPVMNLHFGCAVAYAAWYAARTGLPWRLPGELEFEKFARGVDGRTYPWGEVFDPSWACSRESRPGRPMPAVVDSAPIDRSVYGVRGLAGNVAVWCADDATAIEADRVIAPTADPDPPPDARRYVRGGSWLSPGRFARCAERTPFVASSYLPFVGLRLVRSLEP